MSLLLPESGLLFWMLLAFGIVFFVLAKFGFPVITKKVEERKEFIDQSLKVAQEANEKLEQLKSESDAILVKANTEYSKILDEAAKQREEMLVYAKEEARKAGEKEMAEVKRQIQKEQEEAIRSIRRQVAVLSVEVAEKIIRKHLDDKNEQLELIDRMLDEVLVSKE